MKTINLDQNELHDATLVSLSFTWEEGTCFVVFKTWEPKSSTIMFSNVTELVVPKTHPWGESVSVNHVRLIDETYVEIEMQSGDTIKVYAESASLMK